MPQPFSAFLEEPLCAGGAPAVRTPGLDLMPPLAESNLSAGTVGGATEVPLEHEEPLRPEAAVCLRADAPEFVPCPVGRSSCSLAVAVEANFVNMEHGDEVCSLNLPTALHQRRDPEEVVAGVDFPGPP